MTLDVTRLSPADAVAALRSYPRRYGTALLPLDDDEAAQRALVMGPDGVAPIDLAYDTYATMAGLRRALEEVIVHDNPVLLAALFDPSQRHYSGPAGDDPDAILDLLGTEATGLADRVERVAVAEWSRSGTESGTGRAVTALDVVREAVRTAADNLRLLERLTGH